ncbi:extracellular solute-binding protein [Salinibacterium sp. SYSU T00001]|uniref:ABC transporter substrate-binding protein n=1 Tax=Homoserinimonas sedimenticola TaxID=2986805 RepID=UPI00223580B6|nr:extracellular solute-binding protein [Salinibacterium sedimenticola]MCW4384627.1 extracellular solute-binding protein [Salinibacterium sedimenticola]
MKIRTAALAAGMTAALLLAGCSGGGGNTAAPDVEVDDPALQELIDAAQEEGSLTLYGIPDERVLRALGSAFTEEYGIQVNVLRLVSADLSQKFSTEAEAGATVADAILLTHSPFFTDALDKEWLTPLGDADLPAFEGYPADYIRNDGGAAVVSLVPTQLVYNTDNVTEEPTSWEEYAKPEYKGKLLFAEPDSSPANLTFWSLMIDEYGEEFLEAIAANEPTWMNSAVATTQGVAAGEGDLAHPGVLAIVQTLQESGAPVEAALLGPTTGPEIALGLAADSPNPNAGRLFAHWLLTEEGSNVLAEESGAGSPFGLNMVDGWVSPGPVDEDVAARINELLGVG